MKFPENEAGAIQECIPRFPSKFQSCLSLIFLSITSPKEIWSADLYMVSISFDVGFPE